MTKPRVLILRAPGTNCDEETAFAFEKAGAEAERVHVNRLVDNRTLTERYQILCLPGGFSYGDDIAAGRILASRLDRHLGDSIRRFVEEDRLVLGICNGFQVLMRLGLLTSDLDVPAAATLAWNECGRFDDRWVHLAVDQTPCVFLKDVPKMYLPIAHAEGNFIAASEAVLDKLAGQGRLALRYCSGEQSDVSDEVLPPPDNPNGSARNVAGLCDATGRVFGLMPHPERYIEATHHPYWTRLEQLPDRGDGMQIFQNAVDYFTAG